jgi:hypothetical protein
MVPLEASQPLADPNGWSAGKALPYANAMGNPDAP